MPRKPKRKRQPDPAALLDSLASALNRCEKAGLHPDPRCGIVVSDLGLVLPVKGKWVARMLKRPR